MSQAICSRLTSPEKPGCVITLAYKGAEKNSGDSVDLIIKASVCLSLSASPTYTLHYGLFFITCSTYLRNLATNSFGWPHHFPLES